MSGDDGYTLSMYLMHIGHSKTANGGPIQTSLASLGLVLAQDWPLLSAQPSLPLLPPPSLFPLFPCYFLYHKYCSEEISHYSRFNLCFLAQAL